ncbi:DUF3558 family protein [Actinoplanes sp. NPDC049596]|uniref:DUF3558 family protein n=1 Tax=unclassified Actinoplanes TaxID=2626549 RepID=UPI003447EFAE
MNRWIGVLAAAALAGCSAPAASAPTPTTPAARSGFGSSDQADIPDPCALLSRHDVRELTHREVTQIDEDGADDSAPTRYCQWQQEDGQLAIFLGRTTPQDFRPTVDGNETVDGLGDDAYFSAGHLYVLDGTMQIDVYSRGGDDLPDAQRVAEAVIARL